MDDTNEREALRRKICLAERSCEDNTVRDVQKSTQGRTFPRTSNLAQAAK